MSNTPATQAGRDLLDRDWQYDVTVEDVLAIEREASASAGALDWRKVHEALRLPTVQRKLQAGAFAHAAIAIVAALAAQPAAPSKEDR